MKQWAVNPSVEIMNNDPIDESKEKKLDPLKRQSAKRLRGFGRRGVHLTADLKLNLRCMLQGAAHEGAPRLQVPAEEEAQEPDPEEGDEAVPRGGPQPAASAAASSGHRGQAPPPATLPLPALSPRRPRPEQDGRPRLSRSVRQVLVLCGGGRGLLAGPLWLPREAAVAGTRDMKAAPSPARWGGTGTPHLALVAAPEGAPATARVVHLTADIFRFYFLS
ncbi:unnamed protein product [Nezara viridula]|uniref:Uncharacterized protein n=1 Tax=Nezara viridula TaxID=85310 RepID=A0A9P0GX63_NEZVI|nr:unnamed protein product [Nezara viridula]